MAAGDAITDVSGPIAASGTFLIQPGAGVEWCIHNIMHYGATGSTCKITLTDGTVDVDFDTGSEGGGWINQCFFLTNTHYLKLTNTHASVACVFGYTGIVTK